MRTYLDIISIVVTIAPAHGIEIAVARPRLPRNLHSPVHCEALQVSVHEALRSQMRVCREDAMDKRMHVRARLVACDDVARARHSLRRQHARR